MDDELEEDRKALDEIPSIKPKTPRGKCSRCGKRIALRSNGKLRRHVGTAYTTYTRPTCPGSGTRPVERSVW